MSTPFKSVYEFTVALDREVDETTSVTQEDGSVLTKTIKVKKRIPIWFAFKLPSRAERELAEEERAAWWSRYVEKGILSQAILLKTYANYGGILSDEQKATYHAMQAEYRDVSSDLSHLEITARDNIEGRNKLSLRLSELRSAILDFEQEQSVFFDNTAEAKARAKLIEYLTVHMAYTRLDENSEYRPYFAGETTEAKLASMDRLVEANDEAYLKAAPLLSLVAALYTNGGIDKDTLDTYVKTLEVPEVAAV